MVWGSRVPSLAGGKWMVVLQIYDRRLPDKHAHANISKSFFQCGKYDISVKIQNFQKISKTPRGNDVRKPCTKVGWWKMNGSRWNRWPKVVWYVYTRWIFLKLFFQTQKYDISVEIQNFQKIPKTPRGNVIRKPCTKFGWREMNGSTSNRWPKVA